MAEILPEDSGSIRCICGYSHDDNFTIQCERCNAWQHAKCMDISDENAVPDNYSCPDCSGTIDHVNQERARSIQKRFLSDKHQPTETSRSHGHDEHEDEDRRKRGRRRSESRNAHTTKEKINEPFDVKFCNILIRDNVWSERALQVWAAKNELTDRLRSVSNRESKSPAGISVIRHKSGRKWRFGLNDSAVVLDTPSGAQKFVCEVVGDIMTRHEYVTNKHNQFERLGCPKRGVAFIPGLPLVVDCRRRGSLAVFSRRSSAPNTQLATRKDSHGNLRLTLFTRRAIKSGEELTLGWYWPKHHPRRHTHSDENAQIMENIYWLSDTTESECEPCKSSDGPDLEEDWEYTDEMANWAPEAEKKKKHHVTVVPRRLRPAEILKSENLPSPEPEDEKPRSKREVKLEKDDEDPQVALPSLVWQAASSNVPPPPKKRMSLADYMRKRA